MPLLRLSLFLRKSVKKIERSDMTDGAFLVKVQGEQELEIEASRFVVLGLQNLLYSLFIKREIVGLDIERARHVLDVASLINYPVPGWVGFIARGLPDEHFREDEKWRTDLLEFVLEQICFETVSKHAKVSFVYDKVEV